MMIEWERVEWIFANPKRETDRGWAGEWMKLIKFHGNCYWWWWWWWWSQMKWTANGWWWDGSRRKKVASSEEGLEDESWDDDGARGGGFRCQGLTLASHWSLGEILLVKRRWWWSNGRRGDTHRLRVEGKRGRAAGGSRQAFALFTRPSTLICNARTYNVQHPLRRHMRPWDSIFLIEKVRKYTLSSAFQCVWVCVCSTHDSALPLRSCKGH